MTILDSEIEILNNIYLDVPFSFLRSCELSKLKSRTKLLNVLEFKNLFIF